ncbi:MAG: L-threonylcarbamoyladenylate synthase [Chloroflexota bacterium]|nr:L-threonylcarbamoyladenylate synthase [Chloroflexota bacterium]
MTPPPYGRAAIRRTSEKQALAQALALLRQGEVVALPTDTVYGIASDSLNPDAIMRLYEVKERPPQKAIPLLLANERQMLDVTREAPDVVWDIVSLYWPGALTVVLPAAPHLPAILTAGGDTVAVRLPDSRVVRVLAEGLGRPLAVTSANLSGQDNCRTAEAVFAAIGTRLPLILDGGATPGEQPSTVLDLTTSPPRILREGPVTREMLSPWLNSRT